MGLAGIASRAFTVWFALLLPVFSTFKALSHRPLSDPDLERWCKYWSVIGLFLVVEYSAEWAISWVPFYWELKVIFMLFLSLPQTQGSTYIYDAYLQPFFAANETVIADCIFAAQTNTFTFVKENATVVVNLIINLLNKTPVNRQRPQEQAQNAGQNQGLNLGGALNLFNSVSNAMQSKSAAPEAAGTPSSANAKRTSFQSSPARTPDARSLPNPYEANNVNVNQFGERPDAQLGQRPNAQFGERPASTTTPGFPQPHY